MCTLSVGVRKRGSRGEQFPPFFFRAMFYSEDAFKVYFAKDHDKEMTHTYVNFPLK